MANNFLAKEFVSGDVYIREDLSRAWDADSVLVNIGLVADGSFPIILPAGYPMFGGSPRLTGTVAINTDGFLVEAITFQLEDKANTIPQQIAVFKRGTGIVVDNNSLPALDYVGDAFATDAIKDEMTPLGFVVRDEPLTVSGPQTV